MYFVASVIASPDQSPQHHRAPTPQMLVESLRVPCANTLGNFAAARVNDDGEIDPGVIFVEDGIASWYSSAVDLSMEHAVAAM